MIGFGKFSSGFPQKIFVQLGVAAKKSWKSFTKTFSGFGPFLFLNSCLLLILRQGYYWGHGSVVYRSGGALQEYLHKGPKMEDTHDNLILVEMFKTSSVQCQIDFSIDTPISSCFNLNLQFSLVGSQCSHKELHRDKE